VLLAAAAIAAGAIVAVWMLLDAAADGSEGTVAVWVLLDDADGGLGAAGSGKRGRHVSRWSLEASAGVLLVGRTGWLLLEICGVSWTAFSVLVGRAWVS
jgi:hypothetical protein